MSATARRVALLRSGGHTFVVPSSVMIDADANQGWRSPQWSVATLRRFVGYGNLSIEQPLAFEDLTGAAFIRAHAGVPFSNY